MERKTLPPLMMHPLETIELKDTPTRPVPYSSKTVLAGGRGG